MIAMSGIVLSSKPNPAAAQMTVRLGDLVVAVFDEAGRYSRDPREVSRLATRAIKHLIWRGRKASRAGRFASLPRETVHDRPSAP